MKIPAAVLAWLLLPATLAAQSIANPESVGMSADRLDRLTRHVQEHIDNGMIAGAVTLVAREGSIVHLEAQGSRDREGSDPMEVDDMFVIMSMTKPIVSTALMMLFEEGAFLLDDPVSDWLPEFESMAVFTPDGQGGARYTPAARPITVRHILTHTAGLSSGRGAPRAPDYGTDAWTNPSEAARPDPTDSPLRASVREIANTPLNFHPGERWQYGSATDVVAALVEIISGQNLDDFLRERIFQPLGMNDTHYNVPAAKWDRRARVYEPNRQDGNRVTPRPVTDPRPTEFFGGVAGLTSTAPDYFRFAQMVLNGGELDGRRILSPKTVDLMITNHIGDLSPSVGRGPGYGFGLGYSVMLDPGKAREALTPGAYGWGGAWGTNYITDPVEEMVTIFMIQISSYGHFNLRQNVGTLATQAIIDSKYNADGTVRGYRPIE